MHRNDTNLNKLKHLNSNIFLVINFPEILYRIEYSLSQNKIMKTNNRI